MNASPPVRLERHPARLQIPTAARGLGALHPADGERHQGVPVMERVEVKKLLNGPEGFTPDGEYLLGPTSVKGFWVACASAPTGWRGRHRQGDGGMDRRRSPRVGHVAAGRAPLSAPTTTASACAARTIETYTQYYDIHYPGEERLSPQPAALPHLLPPARPGLFVRRKFGWERPNWFQPYEEKDHGHEPLGWAHHNWSRAIGYEHLQTRAAAGLFDETSFNKIEVRGPARAPSSTASAPITSTSPWVRWSTPSASTSAAASSATSRSTASQRALPHHHRDGVRAARYLVAVAEHARRRLREHRDVGSSYACIGLWGPKQGPSWRR